MEAGAKAIARAVIRLEFRSAFGEGRAMYSSNYSIVIPIPTSVGRGISYVARTHEISHPDKPGFGMTNES